MDTRLLICKENELDKIGQYLYTQQFAELIHDCIILWRQQYKEESKEAVEESVEELVEHNLELQ